MRKGDRVKGFTVHTNQHVVGELGEYDRKENTAEVKTADGTHLCRPETMVLLQPKYMGGSPGSICHMQRCPEHLRYLLEPEIVPC